MIFILISFVRAICGNINGNGTKFDCGTGYTYNPEFQFSRILTKEQCCSNHKSFFKNMIL